MVNGRTLQREIEERRKADAAREDARDERQRLRQEQQEKENLRDSRRWSLVLLVAGAVLTVLVQQLGRLTEWLAAAANHKP